LRSVGGLAEKGRLRSLLRRPWIVRAVWGLVVVSGMGGPPGTLPAEEVREAVSVDASTAARRQLESAERFLAARQWGSALETLQDVEDRFGETLVRVAPGRYVTARYAAQAIRCRMPAEGLQAYRRSVDSEAVRWLRQARKFRDPTPLDRIVKSAFASSVGDDALWLLGQWAWEAGQFDLARRYWKRLLPPPVGYRPDQVGPIVRSPDSSFDDALVRARLVLCSLFGGCRDRAVRELEQFRQLHPDAVGSLAGRSGRLAETLQAVVTESRSWPWPPTPQPYTFGADSARSGQEPEPDDVGHILWSSDLPADSFTRPDGPAGSAPPVFFPLVVRGKLFLNDARFIYALDLQTGRPAWSPGGRQAAVYAVSGAESAGPIQPAVGRPKYTMTFSDGVLYARMGPPVTWQATHEFRVRSEIVGLNLWQEGKLVWRVTTDRFQPPTAGWAFEGSPVVDQGRVYVALTRTQPHAEVSIMSFDQATGKPVWRRRICSPLRTTSDRWNALGHGLLTMGPTRIYYSTNLGAIAALEREDGRVAWVVTYTPDVSGDRERLRRLETTGLTPCVYHAGIVCAAPQDTDSIFLLDAESGIILHELKLPERVQFLLGVTGGTLVASGRFLWGIDIVTGRLRWHVGGERPEDRGYGRGTIAGQWAYWPTREEILVVDGASGRVVRRIPLREKYGLTGGNLLAADGKLILAGSKKLTVFSPSGFQSMGP